MALQFDVKPSNGCRGGVRYVTAKRSWMNNKGEKYVKVRSKEEHTCVLNMHVRDVSDASHERVSNLRRWPSCGLLERWRVYRTRKEKT